MVGGDDEHGVFPQAVLVHGIEDPAQGVVAHAEQGRVVAPTFIHGPAFLLGDLRVTGKVELRAGVVGGIEIAVFLRRNERGVGIEALDLEQPVVLLVVGGQELSSLIEDLRLAHVLLGRPVLAVDPVLAQPVAKVGRHLGVGDLRLPGIAFLATGALPAGILGVVGPATVFPVVAMVTAKVGVGAAVPQHPGHGVVEGLQRAPGAMEKVVAARVEFAAGRHAGHAADEATVENESVFRQPGVVGRVHPVVAIGRQEVTLHGVE